MARAERVSDNVRALHRARIVLASRDRPFVRLLGFFLERRGYAVALTHRTGHILGAVERHAADVVVLDADGAVADAARVAAALEGLHPTVRVLLVADEGDSAVGVRVLSKAIAPEQLAAEIERSYVAAGIVPPAAPARER